jgi:ATP-binding cassette, subfamily B, bacterial HlyB/CyaB
VGGMDEAARPVRETRDSRSQTAGATKKNIAAETRLPVGLRAMIQAARYHGIELDANEFSPLPGETTASAAALSLWGQNCGLWARGVRLRWRQLFQFNDTGPVVLLFKDGGAGLLTGADAGQSVVFVASPEAPSGTAPIAVDELRLSQVWAGEAVLLRANRGQVAADAPFSLYWLVALVLQEHRSLRSIGVASVTMSILTVFPPLLVMAMVNKVLQFHSTSTLVLLSVMMGVIFAYEAFLGYASRWLAQSSMPGSICMYSRACFGCLSTISSAIRPARRCFSYPRSTGSASS